MSSEGTLCCNSFPINGYYSESQTTIKKLLIDDCDQILNSLAQWQHFFLG